MEAPEAECGGGDFNLRRLCMWMTVFKGWTYYTSCNNIVHFLVVDAARRTLKELKGGWLAFCIVVYWRRVAVMH